MKKRTRLLCFMLCAVLAAAALASCGNKNKKPDPTGSGSNNTPKMYADFLPEEGIDLNGFEYRVLTYETGNNTNPGWNAYIQSDVMNGDAINDAAFKRNAELENRFNCFISCVEHGGFMETATVFGNLVLSGVDSCEIAIIQNSGVSTGNLVATGVISDVSHLPYMNLSASYYLQSANEVFTFNGKQYFFSGDAVCSLYSNSFIWANMDEWNKRELESPYEMVREGEWTFEQCFGLAKDTYVDVNGNSEHDMADFYGITGIPTTLGYCFHGADGLFFEYTEDGFRMPVTSEKNVNIIEKLKAKLDDPDCYWIKDGYKEIFFAGRCLMFYSGASITELLNANFSTTVLPLPKYDENQESYRSILRGALVCVPITNINDRATGIMTEAMFAASSRYTRPAFFEKYVDLHILQNAESVEMLSIIMDSGVHNFVDYFDPSGLCNGYGLITNVLETRSDLSSAWATIKTAVENGYDEFFANLEE